MVTTVQKTVLTFIASALMGLYLPIAAHALQTCSKALLTFSQKRLGEVTYLADNCSQPWQTQSIQLNFNYEHKVPAWAFKRAAQHFLAKNVVGYTQNSPLYQVSGWYKSVQAGQQYQLSYLHTQQQLTLKLDGQQLGQMSHPNINQYFNIWFGTAPFSPSLKQQLLKVR